LTLIHTNTTITIAMLSRRFAARSSQRMLLNSSAPTQRREISNIGIVGAATAFTAVATRRPILTLGVGAITSLAVVTVMCFSPEGESGDISLKRRDKDQIAVRNKAISEGKATRMDTLEKTFDDVAEVASDVWEQAQDIGSEFSKVATVVIADSKAKFEERAENEVEPADIADDASMWETAQSKAAVYAAKAKILADVAVNAAGDVKDEMVERLDADEEQKAAIDHTLERAKTEAGNLQAEAAEAYDSAKDAIIEKSAEWQEHDLATNVKRTTREVSTFAKEKGREAYDTAGELALKAEDFARKNDFDDEVDSVKDTAKQAKHMAQDLGEEAKDKAAEAQSKARRTYRDVKDKAEDTYDGAKDKLSEAKSKTRQIYRDTKDKAQDFSEEAKDKLSEGKAKARQSYDAAKDKAQDFGEEAKDKLSEGKSKARQTYRDAKDDTEHAYENVKAEGKRHARKTERSNDDATKSEGNKDHSWWSRMEADSAEQNSDKTKSEGDEHNSWWSRMEDDSLFRAKAQ
jgi:hypothetical protein